MTDHFGGNLVHRLVEQHLAAGRGRAACYVGGGAAEVTYTELYSAAGTLASYLRDAGVAPGNRCLVVADDTVAVVVVVLALWWAGCVPVPVAPAYTAAEIAYIAADCGAEQAYLDIARRKSGRLCAMLRRVTLIEPGCVHNAIRRALVGDVPMLGEPVEQLPDDEVLVQYTSGTTGLPRGVRHSARGVHAVIDGFGEVLRLGPDDTVLSTAKLALGYGLGNSLLLPLAAGARTALLAGLIDAFTVSNALSSRRPTVLFSVPRFYRTLGELAERSTGLSAGTLRLAVSAADDLPVSLARRCTEFLGVPLLNGFGATEVLHVAICGNGTDTGGSLGRAVPGMAYSVRDDEGRVLGEGEVGRLHVVGPSVALGYVDGTIRTSHAFGDGGVYTGDIVRRRRGLLEYLCRAGDMLDVDGFPVSTSDIEHVIRDTRGVVDCAVVVESDRGGLQRPVAYVVMSAAPDRNKARTEIMSSLHSQLPPFMLPSRIELLTSLPLTSTGKLARSLLRSPRTP